MQGEEEFFAAAAELPMGKGPSALGATSEGAARRGEGQQLCLGLRRGGRGQREDRQREGWAARGPARVHAAKVAKEMLPSLKIILK